MFPTPLFEDAQNTDNKEISNIKTLNDLSEISKIKGLIYLPEYITEAEQSALWEAINAEKWLDDLKRRVQHYGYKYHYKARFVDYSMKIGGLPEWVTPLSQRFLEEEYMQSLPDQLIVNEYFAGQGIASHIDCTPCFGDTIVSLSLGSACTMDFIHTQTKEKITVYIEPRSLVVMKKEARYAWTHGIAGRKTDCFKEIKRTRSTRISLTFRNIILSN